jgi:hypothetical protein
MSTIVVPAPAEGNDFASGMALFMSLAEKSLHKRQLDLKKKELGLMEKGLGIQEKEAESLATYRQRTAAVAEQEAETVAGRLSFDINKFLITSPSDIARIEAETNRLASDTQEAIQRTRALKFGNDMADQIKQEILENKRQQEVAALAGSKTAEAEFKTKQAEAEARLDAVRSMQSTPEGVAELKNYLFAAEKEKLSADAIRGMSAEIGALKATSEQLGVALDFTKNRHAAFAQAFGDISNYESPEARASYVQSATEFSNDPSVPLTKFSEFMSKAMEKEVKYKESRESQKHERAMELASVSETPTPTDPAKLSLSVRKMYDEGALARNMLYFAQYGQYNPDLRVIRDPSVVSRYGRGKDVWIVDFESVKDNPNLREAYIAAKPISEDPVAAELGVPPARPAAAKKPKAGSTADSVTVGDKSYTVDGEPMNVNGVDYY